MVVTQTKTAINDLLARLETDRRTQDEKFERRLTNLEKSMNEFSSTLESIRVASDGHLQLLKSNQGVAKQQHKTLEQLTTRVAAEGGASSFVTLEDLDHLRDGLTETTANAFDKRMERVMQRLIEMEGRILYEDDPPVPANHASMSLQTGLLQEVISDVDVSQANPVVQTPISPTAQAVEAAADSSVVIPSVSPHPKDIQAAIPKTHESHADLDDTSDSLPQDPIVDEVRSTAPAVCKGDFIQKEILTYYTGH